MKKPLLLVIISLLFSLPVYCQQISLVSDINPGSGPGNPHHLTEYNGSIYYFAFNGIHTKLYKTDSNGETTFIGPEENPNGVVWYLTKFNNQLFFMYDDGVHGYELWTSDGTPEGTVLFQDIRPGALGSQPEKFTECNGLLFFYASTDQGSQRLYATDGTIDSTQMLGNQLSIPFSETQHYIVLNNKIYFQGNSGSGYGMWTSDGTQQGTVLVKPGLIGASGGTYAVMNNKFYFQSGDNTTGNELWVSDGTDAGTYMLKDINTFSFGSEPDKFFTDGNLVYFQASDGITGRELWATDGTSDGTILLKDIYEGALNGLPDGFINFNNTTYFFGNNGSGISMFQTNGTPESTLEINSIPGCNIVQYSTLFDNKIYFYAEIFVGKLYSSNGTAEGTTMIIEANTFSSSSGYGFGLLNFNNELYMPNIFGDNGNELCKLNNTQIAVSEINKNNIVQVYPNPTSDKINIKLDQALNNYSIQINDASNRTLHRFENLNGANFSIDNLGLSQGIYILTLYSSNIKFETKIIIN